MSWHKSGKTFLNNNKLTIVVLLFYHKQGGFCYNNRDANTKEC